ncbi:MAG: diacylglycerol kinase family protein [Bacteroidia bacterium]
MSNKTSYLEQRMAAFRYAFRGLSFLFRTQAHARIHGLAALCVVVLGVWLQVSWGAWAILALCIGSVFAAETFNTSVEELTNLVSPNYNERAGRTKDLAAAAVLLTSIMSIVCGLLIFGPLLWAKINALL